MDGIGRYAGIDWASTRHAVCVIDDRGAVVMRVEVGHSAAGLRSGPPAPDVEGVAIERPDGPVVDALLEAGLRVVVIASRQVKALRTRHCLVGNKDDRADAFILAVALRTDGDRVRHSIPTFAETVALRATVASACKDLCRGGCRLVQQLPAHLELTFPGRSTCSRTSTRPSPRRS